MGEPTVTDGGCAGLEQSQHHPLAGRSQYSPTPQLQASDSPGSSSSGEDDLTESLIQRIKACVIPGKVDEVTRRDDDGDSNPPTDTQAPHLRRRPSDYRTAEDDTARGPPETGCGDSPASLLRVCSASTRYRA